MARRQALVKERSRMSVKGSKQQRSKAEERVARCRFAEMDEVRYPFRRLGANAVNGGKRRPRGDESHDAGEQSEP